jgi:hypothetical protein
MTKMHIWIRGMLAAVSGASGGVLTGFAAVGIDPATLRASTYQLRLNGQLLTGPSGVAATSRGSFVQGHLPVFDANNNVTDSGVSPTNVSNYFNRAAGNLG